MKYKKLLQGCRTRASIQETGPCWSLELSPSRGLPAAPPASPCKASVIPTGKGEHAMKARAGDEALPSAAHTQLRPGNNSQIITQISAKLSRNHILPPQQAAFKLGRGRVFKLLCSVSPCPTIQRLTLLHNQPSEEHGQLCRRNKTVSIINDPPRTRGPLLM